MYGRKGAGGARGGGDDKEKKCGWEAKVPLQATPFRPSSAPVKSGTGAPELVTRGCLEEPNVRTSAWGLGVGKTARSKDLDSNNKDMETVVRSSGGGWGDWKGPGKKLGTPCASLHKVLPRDRWPTGPSALRAQRLKAIGERCARPRHVHSA